MAAVGGRCRPQLGELVPGPMNPGSDRPDRNVGDVSGLSVPEPEELGEYEGAAVVGREFVKQRVLLGRAEMTAVQMCRRVPMVVTLLIDRNVDAVTTAERLAADAAGDHERPCPDRCVSPIAPDRGDDPGEGLLRSILGGRVISQHRAAVAPDVGLDRCAHDTERMAIAAGGPPGHRLEVAVIGGWAHDVSVWWRYRKVRAIQMNFSGSRAH